MSTTKETGERQSAEVRWANSQRVYVAGARAGVRVPLREVALNATRGADGRVEENQPVHVYETSGPWGDPAVACDERAGLAPLRREWIVARADVEEYAGREVKPEDDGYLTAGAAEYAQAKTKGRLEYFPGLRRLIRMRKIIHLLAERFARTENVRLRYCLLTSPALRE